MPNAKELTLSDISHRKRLMVALFAVTAMIAVTFIYLRMRAHALGSITLDQVDDGCLQHIKEILSGKEIDDNLDKFYSVEVRTLLLDHVKKEYTAVTTALKSMGIIIVFVKVCERLIKSMERGEMTMEQWLGVILSLAIPVVFIAEYDTVIKAIQLAGDTFYEMITASRQNLTGSTKTFIDSVVGKGFVFERPTWTSWLNIDDYLSDWTEQIILQLKAYATGFTIQLVLEISTFFINLIEFAAADLYGVICQIKTVPGICFQTESCIVGIITFECNIIGFISGLWIKPICCRQIVYNRCL